jgi:hypothetical protein
MDKSLTGLTAIFGISLPLAIAIVQPAQALPEAQIVEKLRGVPIFTVTIAKTPNGNRDFVWESESKSPKARLYTRAFIGMRDAQAFLKLFQKEQPQVGKSAQVSPIPLSAVYKMQLEAKQKSKNMGFMFVPTEQQIKNALTILKEPYKKNINYPVPLFVVTVKDKNQNVAIQRNDMTQMFFDKQEAQQWLRTARQQNPKLAAKAQITVESLQNMLESLHKINHPQQQKLVFVPSRENVEIVRRIQAAQTQPTSAPASTSPKR